MNEELEWGQVECCSDSLSIFLHEELTKIGTTREGPCYETNRMHSELGRVIMGLGGRKKEVELHLLR